MRVVVDTNVLLSAVWRDRNPEAVVRWIMTTQTCDWLVTAAIMAEYRTVLSRPKFALPADLLAAWLKLIEDHTMEIEAAEEPDFARDPKDAKFLACVLATEADVLLTGDHDFESAPELGACRRLSVAEFHAEFVA